MSQVYDALISYTRFDDTHHQEYLTTFRDKFSGEVQAYTGRPFHIFQDIEDIKWGQNFEERINAALTEITFFIPILTPSFFNSKWCRYELEKFLYREQQLGRNDLVLPVYFIRVPGLESEALRVNDPLMQRVATCQYIDWRDLRFESFDSTKVRRKLAQMAENITDALHVPAPSPVLKKAVAQPDEPSPASTPAPSPAASTPAPSPAPTPAPPPASPVVELPDGVTLELIEIPKGPFLMGSSDDDPDANQNEKPQHERTLPAYWIGKTPITNAQFRPFVKDDGYTNRHYWSNAGWQWRTRNKRTQPYYWNDMKWNDNAQPVIGITWYEAMAYCRWLSARTGDYYCLPSEAEWEKAARGTDGRIYPWGNQTPDRRLATFNRNKNNADGRTTRVFSHPTGASFYGVLDMAGNVCEWTCSEFRDYPYERNDGREDTSNPKGKYFTLRGGAWHEKATSIRCSSRGYGSPESRYNDRGFRIIRSDRSSD